MNETASPAQSDITDITWAMMSDAGIEIYEVEASPTGGWYSLHRDDLHIDFGPATAETGEAAQGWDVTSYEPRDGGRDGEQFDTFETAAATVAHVARIIAAADRVRVTDDDIRALRDEAGTAGDLDQAAICDRALSGDQDAAEECGRVIIAARAMA